MILRRAVVGSIGFYKRWISPLFPPACRFHPSCSEYARDAVELHGVWRGGGLALWRLLRCQPFARGGFDPVPLPVSRERGAHRRLSDKRRVSPHG